MRLDALPAALDAAAARLAALADDLAAQTARAVLDAARPPRATGALANSGRVIGTAAVFGGGTVDYAAPVQAATGFLDRAVADTEATAAELADRLVASAITL